MKRPLPRRCLHALTLLLAAPLAAQGLTPIQVAKLRYVTAAWDCGEAGVVFTRSVPPLAGDPPGSSRTHLYQRNEQGEEKTLWGGKVSVRGVSVRGTKIYLLDRGKGDKTTQVYEMDPDDGKTTRVTNVDVSVLSYKWSPDGKHIAFTSLAPHDPAVAKARKAGFNQKIVDEDFRHIDLWVWEQASGKARKLTKGQTVFSYVWAPNSRKLAVGVAPRNAVDDRYMFTRLYQVDPTTRAIRSIVRSPGKLGAYTWSPDSRHLAFVSAAHKRDPHAGMLYLKSPERDDAVCLTPGFKGMVHDVQWTRGKAIQAVVSKGVKTYLVTIETPNNQMRIHAGGNGLAFRHFHMTGSTALVVADTATHPREVYRIDTKSGEATRLTDSNPWLADIKLGRQEIVRFKARDGLEIEGLLMYPVDHEPGQRYPLVIVVHGGPEAHFSEGWNTSYSRWGQMLCARGYLAWLPNYRASTGYGVEFAKANHGDVMGGEFHDHLDAIAHLDSKGLIDAERVGIGGGSYGGYTAAWAATRHSKHFAAAVSFVPFVDIRTKWLTSDIPYEFFLVHYEEKWPHRQLDYLAERSPLTYAEDCRTPLLLLGGTADPRVHPSQPFMLYRAVKFHTNTPVRYVQYPGEGHGNRRNTNRFDYTVRTLRWFDHYLKTNDRRAALPDFHLDYSEWYQTK
jgi:dipeptidyl aminopeptidase/acylaminoacyl peptidase